MIPITEEQYFAAHPDSAEITEEMRSAARVIISKANALLARAEAQGVVLEVNQHKDSPHFGTHISGQGNGAHRLQSCAIGAPKSKHKTANAIDICDRSGKLDAWCDANKDALKEEGVGREAPSATEGWCHWQNGPSASGNWTFIP